MKNFLLFVFCIVSCSTVWAETLTYRIVEYDNNVQAYILAPCGNKPQGSYAIFENEYGETAGNRYNQIPRNKKASLWLMGWDNCTIESITLSLCSNNKAGSAALQLFIGKEEYYGMRTESFDSEAWFGRWVSKDCGIYVDIEKPLPSAVTVPQDSDVCITLKGGTSEGSLYINAITIDYTPGQDVAVESALPWIFEKMAPKEKVQEGDILMFYRSGNAAADIDGMETSHYLDAVGIKSTAQVDDPTIMLFETHKTTDGHWILINQYGDTLGAKAAQNLAWNEGVKTWDISNGYDGATISCTNNKYGTIRFNAPAGSYARFWNYTSTSLTLPYLYRQDHQQEPVISKELKLSSQNRTVEFGVQDTVILRHTFSPATTTDQRIVWQSSNEAVAKVTCGLVDIVGLGEAIITATSLDGGSAATCQISVVEHVDGLNIINADKQETPAYDLYGRKLTQGAKHIFIFPNSGRN